MTIKKKYIRICIAVIFISIVNVHPVNVFFAIIIGDKSLKFSDYHFSGSIPKGFSCWINNDGILAVEKKFSIYRGYYPNDSILYRNFAIQPLKFWRWSEYLTSDLYSYPYKKISDEWIYTEYGTDLDSLQTLE